MFWFLMIHTEDDQRIPAPQKAYAAACVTENNGGGSFQIYNTVSNPTPAPGTVMRDDILIIQTSPLAEGDYRIEIGNYDPNAGNNNSNRNKYGKFEFRITDLSPEPYACSNLNQTKNPDLFVTTEPLCKIGTSVVTIRLNTSALDSDKKEFYVYLIRTVGSDKGNDANSYIQKIIVNTDASSATTECSVAYASPTPRATNTPTSPPITSATTPTFTPTPPDAPACLPEGSTSCQSSDQCCNGLTCYGLDQRTTGTCRQTLSPPRLNAPPEVTVGESFNLTIEDCPKNLQFIKCSGPNENYNGQWYSCKDSSESNNISVTTATRTPSTGTTVTQEFTPKKAGELRIQAACRATYNVGETAVYVKEPEEKEEPRTVACPVCAEPSYPYFNKRNNTCCKFNACRIDIDLEKEIIAAQGDQATLEALKDRVSEFIHPVTVQECPTGSTCIEGKGCNFVQPDPQEPPCVRRNETTGQCEEIKVGNDCLRVNPDTGECEQEGLFLTIATDAGGFVRNILGILLSISGMVAVYLILRSAFQFMTSRGNPEAIQEAKDRLTSAIVGLLFIIFSLVIIQVIGVDILQIPGFTP